MYPNKGLPVKKWATTFIVASLCSFFLFNNAYAQWEKRPMVVITVEELGLDIWIEAKPRWSTRVTLKGKQPLFIAESPLNSYPPAIMTWATFPTLRITEDTLKEVVHSAIKTAAGHYNLSASQIKNIDIQPASYGKLKGYDAVFDGKINNKWVSVKMFFAHQKGKPLISMQVYTQQGKLGHLSENIRRSWTNISYLN
ncbi:MAG: hypothetical protein L3J01_01900 [Thiomicrorhabdus sp.]|nr:hypothetical protein [Thiomicrorhabdus sp.]